MTMKAISIFLFVLWTIFIARLHGQDIQKIGIPELEQILSNEQDKVFVINFWATWCAPCVTELPHIQKVAGEYDFRDVEFKLISLDFPSQIDSRLIPFLKEKNVQMNVLLMTDLDYNKWISKVDPDWKGNIPATLIYNRADNERIFIPHVLNEDELKENIEMVLN